MKILCTKNRFFTRLRKKGFNLNCIEDLMEPGLNFELIRKEINEFLSSCLFKTKFTRNLGAVSRFQILQEEMTPVEAKEYIESQIVENDLIGKELKKVGIRVLSIYDLVNTNQPYPEAIPTLVAWLPKLKNETIKQGVVRALTVKYAGENAKMALAIEFDRYRDSNNKLQTSLRWSIGNALSVVLEKQDLDQILNYVKDPRYGSSRITLIEKLAQWKIYDSIDILMNIFNEEEEDLSSVGRSINALGRLKAQQARAAIEKYLTHDHPSIQKAAKLSLERIDR